MAANIITQEVTWYDAKVAVPTTDEDVLVIYQSEGGLPHFAEINYSQKYQAWNVSNRSGDIEHAMDDIKYWTDLTPLEKKETEEEDG